MADVFLKLLNMSIAASWLILAVLVLRLVLKKAPKWINPLLWGVVALRLVCPFSIESALSLIPSAETVGTQVVTVGTPGLSGAGDAVRNIVRPAINSGISAIDSAVNPVIDRTFTPAAQTGADPMLLVSQVAAVVWVLGLAALLVWAIASWMGLRNRVSTAVRERDNIYRSEFVTSPFVLGIFRQKIYLPYGMDDADAEYVIAHERAHIARRDTWLKPLGYLILCLHWFNPLVWLGYALFCRDIEYACDERVARGLDPVQRADYSEALLACSVRKPRVSACPLAFGEGRVAGRVRSVLTYKKPALWIAAAAVVVVAVVAVCFLTNPVSGDGEYTPPLDFTPESVWRAEPYGDGAQAVLYLGAETDGARPFRVFTAFSFEHSLEGADTVPSARAFGGTAEDGVFTVSGEGLPYVSSLTGRLSVDGASLSIDYTAAEPAQGGVQLYLEGDDQRIVMPNVEMSYDDIQPLPTHFTRLSGSEAGTAMYALPAAADEIVYAPNGGSTAAFYDRADYFYVTADPEYAPQLRGIGIGDGMDDIFARFPVDESVAADAAEYTAGSYDERRLYGDGAWWPYYMNICYVDGAPAYIIVGADATVTYYLDSELNVGAIAYDLTYSDAYNLWSSLVSEGVITPAGGLDTDAVSITDNLAASVPAAVVSAARDFVAREKLNWQGVIGGDPVITNAEITAFAMQPTSAGGELDGKPYTLTFYRVDYGLQLGEGASIDPQFLSYMTLDDGWLRTEDMYMLFMVRGGEYDYLGLASTESISETYADEYYRSRYPDAFTAEAERIYRNMTGAGEFSAEDVALNGDFGGIPDAVVAAGREYAAGQASWWFNNGMTMSDAFAVDAVELTGFDAMPGAAEVAGFTVDFYAPWYRMRIDRSENAFLNNGMEMDGEWMYNTADYGTYLVWQMFLNDGESLVYMGEMSDRSIELSFGTGEDRYALAAQEMYARYSSGGRFNLTDVTVWGGLNYPDNVDNFILDFVTERANEIQRTGEADAENGPYNVTRIELNDVTEHPVWTRVDGGSLRFLQPDYSISIDNYTSFTSGEITSREGIIHESDFYFLYMESDDGSWTFIDAANSANLDAFYEGAEDSYRDRYEAAALAMYESYSDSARYGTARFVLPSGLNTSGYDVYTGYCGGWLLGPQAYRLYSTGMNDGTNHAIWSGSAVTFNRESYNVTMRGEFIASLLPSDVRSTLTGGETLYDPDVRYPAYIGRMTYDLYTAADEATLLEEGVRLTDAERQSDYWAVFLVKPGEQVGYMLSLDAAQFSREDVIDFAATFRFPGDSWFTASDVGYPDQFSAPTGVLERMREYAAEEASRRMDEGQGVIEYICYESDAERIDTGVSIDGNELAFYRADLAMPFEGAQRSSEHVLVLIAERGGSYEYIGGFPEAGMSSVLAAYGVGDSDTPYADAARNMYEEYLSTGGTSLAYVDPGVMQVMTDLAAGRARPADGFSAARVTGVDSWPDIAEPGGVTLDFHSPRYQLLRDGVWSEEYSGEVYALFLDRDGESLCFDTITGERLEIRYGEGEAALAAAAEDMYADFLNG